MGYLQSFGAAQTVTGSCHFLQLHNGMRLLIDCGMFQGCVEGHNLKPFEFNPRDVDFLLITHAHLDHVGRIPKLVKEGFNGTIVTHQATLDLAEIVLMDSAKLQEESYKTAYKKAQRMGKEKKVPKPLYDKDDVRLIYQLQSIKASYNQKIDLGHGVKVVFKNAGHILGSSVIELSFEEEGVEKRVVFSGDLGNHNDIVMPSPQTLSKANALFIESTYGNRNHKGIKGTNKEFAKIIKKTLHKNGNVLIPSFAIERTQEILCLLKQMYDSGELPVCQVFLDSPMAIRATQIYEKYHTELTQSCSDFLERDGSIFDFPYLHYTLDVHESMKINDEKERCIIIAGAGMCNGGRVWQHFKHRLWNKKNALVFVGYQVEGTLGRKIVDGAKIIQVYEEDIIVKAKVYTINGFSAHADQKELINWMKSFKQLDRIFIIHGEPKAQKHFRKEINKHLGKKAHIVQYGEKIGI